MIWPVDEQQALIFLASLNRLQGADDPIKRASLLQQLTAETDLKQLATMLPEAEGQLKALLAINTPPDQPQPPKVLHDLPIAVHFFLTPSQKQRVDQTLSALGGSPADALMTLIDNVSDSFST